jgi:hypothetical protein
MGDYINHEGKKVMSDSEQQEERDEKMVRVELRPEEAFGKPIRIPPGKKLRIVIKKPELPISR